MRRKGTQRADEPAAPPGAAPVAERADAALAWLRRHASAKVRTGMARYGIPSDHALGVSVGVIQAYGKKIGRDQALAEALWDTGVYEARLLASFVGEPVRLTPASMERWCRDFDSWAIVDTVCFKLFDQSPHAWKKVVSWSRRTDEFQKRAGVVLLACLAAHDADADDAAFLRCLPVVEKAAADERNFVKKGVSWALRMIGRRSGRLRAEAVALASRLTESPDSAPRWVGRDVLRDLRRTVRA